ncbi:MAG: acetyl-CoA C-acetyltransferase [Pseudomonadota bacterium]
MADEAFVLDAVRTPRGKGRAGGALQEVKPVTLLTGLMSALQARTSLDTALVEDVVLGCVSPVGEQGADIAKTAALVAGWDWNAAGVQINRFCASGLEAVNLAAQKVRSGWESLIVAGGVESMSRVPMFADGGAWQFDPEFSLATDYVPQGIGADLIATLGGWARAAVDAYAAQSHRRAAAAWQEGRFARSVVPVRDRLGRVVLATDEVVRPDADGASLGRLKAVFEAPGRQGYDAVALRKYGEVETIDHVHTAGNSSAIVDGAALVLIGSAAMADRLGVRPRARIVSTALAGADPTIMLTGPMPATRKALQRAGLQIGDIDLFEVNEAFASIPMRFMQELGVPHDKVNVNGGAIAMGHPLGATGAMLIGTLVDELERRGQRYGLATMCIGGGMGIATVIERV